MCECGTVGHEVCEAMGVSVTVYEDFVDGAIDSLLVSCQGSVTPVMKGAKVYSVCTW